MTGTASPAVKLAFKPLRNDRTFEIVVRMVREKLEKGELHPGDKLPPERELAKQLDVSRNVVREALRTLENAGLTETRKGAYGGAFIRQGSPDLIGNALKDLLTLNAISLSELFEARVMTLEIVLQLIARRDTPSDLTSLERNIEDTEAAVEAGDSARRISLAREFYHEIAMLSGNRALVLNIDALTDMIQTYLRYRVGDMDGSVLLQSRRAFIECLRTNRFDAARAELSAHLVRVHERLWKRDETP